MGIPVHQLKTKKSKKIMAGGQSESVRDDEECMRATDDDGKVIESK